MKSQKPSCSKTSPKKKKINLKVVCSFKNPQKFEISRRVQLMGIETKKWNFKIVLYLFKAKIPTNLAQKDVSFWFLSKA